LIFLAYFIQALAELPDPDHYAARPNNVYHCTDNSRQDGSTSHAQPPIGKATYKKRDKGLMEMNLPFQPSPLAQTDIPLVAFAILGAATVGVSRSPH
jgi:hypothetical protein